MGRLPLIPIPGDPVQSSRATLDPVALVASVGTLLACCPIASVVGVTLGLVSYNRIRKSEGRLRGKRLALGCAVTSLVVGVISWSIGNRFQTAGRSAMSSEVRIAMDQFLSGSVEPSAWWSDVDAGGLLAFQSEVRDRLGQAKTASVTETDIEVSLTSIARFRLLIESESHRAVASVTVGLVTDSRTFLPSIRIHSLEIENQGDPSLVFPPREEAATPDTLLTR